MHSPGTSADFAATSSGVVTVNEELVIAGTERVNGPVLSHV
jgi:hypothetical protein